MSFKDIKTRVFGLEGRILEDELYRVVWEEIESGEMDRAAQARALEEGAGDDGRIRSAYIKHRIRRLKDDLALSSRGSSEKSPVEDIDEKPISKTQHTSCSFCGAKIGWFKRSGATSLCRSCSRRVLGAKASL